MDMYALAPLHNVQSLQLLITEGMGKLMRERNVIMRILTQGMGETRLEKLKPIMFEMENLPSEKSRWKYKRG